MTRNSWRLTAGILILTVFLSRADGQQLVDQSYTGEATGGGATSLGTQGQSFTPTLTGIDFVTFKVADYSLPKVGGKLSVAIAKGANGGGAGLGYSNMITVPADSEPGIGEFIPYTFIFPERVALTPGDVYSISVLVDSGVFALAYGGSNAYPRGNYYAANYMPNEDVDAWFIEGIFVPEPTGAALLTVAILFCCAGRNRVSRHPAAAK